MIRPADIGDAPTIAAWEAEVFAADAWSEAAVEAELTLGRGWIAADGYVLTRLAGDVVDLQRIGVREEARRSGTASALLAEAVRGARQDGAHRMLLEVSAANSGAMSFYAARGFTEIDRRPRYYRDGTDAVVLRLSFAPACG